MEERQDDEISLLDLFVVLLKHRRLILVTTALSIAAALGGLFLLPGASGADGNDAKTVQVEVTPIITPKPFNEAFTVDLGLLALNYANDTTLRTALAAKHLGGAAGVKLSTSTALKNGKTVLTLTLVAPDGKAGVAFLTDLVTELDRRLKETLPDPAFRESVVPTLAVSTGIKILPGPAASRGKKMAVVVVFAAFFLSIFLAFVAEYIQRVRSDEDSMGKITQALRKRR